ncbi:hypothetical protein ACS8Y6_00990 [Salinisphaera sp. RV14]|uniref:hypothetical protein n=1 Tax=unclassified Salinisphaera TaxID=2649847 RepID=UPI003F82FDFE
MNSVLLHRIFGLVFCTVGAMTAISGFMFWFDPPDVPLNNVFLAAMVGVGAIAFIGGLGIFRRLAAARWAMIVLAALVLCVDVIGIGHAIWIANIGALVIMLTAVMPLVLAISALYELGRPARDTH